MIKGTALKLAMLGLVLISQAVMAEELTQNGRKIPADILGGGQLSDSARNSLPGEMYADVMLGSLTAQRTFRNTLPTIHSYSQTAHMTASGAGAGSASDVGDGKRWVMWDTPWITHEARKNEGGYLGYNTISSGFATGVSRLVGESGAIGVAIGSDARKLTNRDGYHWRAKTEALHAGVYGGTAIGCLFFDAYAGFSKSWHRSERGIINGGDMIIAKGNYADTVWSAGAKASYVWVLPNEFRIIPSVGLDYAYMRFDQFNESWQGRGESPRVNESDRHFLQMPISVAVNRTFSADFLNFKGFSSMWTPEARAGWAPQFGAKRTSIGYMGTTAESADLGRSYGFIGAGLKIKLADRFIFAVDYNYSFHGKYNNHTVTGTYGVSF